LGASNIAFASNSITGKIAKVFAGEDDWYGVRFYLDISSDNSNGACNTDFIYTEPEPGSGHNQKVSVFLAAYMANKTVTMSVASGRNGYCKLVEGSMY
jgi:hypothetical protein